MGGKGAFGLKSLVPAVYLPFQTGMVKSLGGRGWVLLAGPRDELLQEQCDGRTVSWPV